MGASLTALHPDRRSEADHYEVQAYYTTTSADALNSLEAALKAVPGA